MNDALWSLVIIAWADETPVVDFIRFTSFDSKARKEEASKQAKEISNVNALFKAKKVTNVGELRDFKARMESSGIGNLEEVYQRVTRKVPDSAFCFICYLSCLKNPLSFFAFRF